MATNQVRVLTLNKDENLQHILYRLEKEWYLRFALGPSLVASTVRVFCNHPPNKATPFERTTYYELEWKSTSGSKSDTHDIFTGIDIVIAGSFNYFFTIDCSDNIENANGQGYFLIDPTLSVGTQGDHLTLDCLQVQTVLAKSLGHFDEWEGRLYVAKATGYNMVHFTPLQALGTSNSSYSIKDQLKLNPIFNREGQDFSFDDVEKLLRKMNSDWQVLSMTDLVYNHTADNSPWLQEHPECGFNLENSPHLKPAYLVDRIFNHFSADVGDGKYENRGLTPFIDGHSLGKMRDILLHEVFPSHKLQEFYTVNVDEIMKRFKHGIEENRQVSGKGKHISIIQDPLYQRNQCRVDMDTALSLYNTDRPGVSSRSQRITECCSIIEQDLHALNQSKINEINDHIGAAVNHFLANAEWSFVNEHGPKLKKVTEKTPLMHDYFIVSKRLTGSLASEESFMYGESAKYIFACNGWVMGDDPLSNFAEPGSNVYLRRELVGWGDSAKLNFGKKPEDCPYLWQRMKEYTELTARLCHGVRLDNCHSTPIHVAEYMLDAARKIRPDLYVVAELFTGGEHLDNLFINRLGINSLIREAMSASDSHKLGALIHRYGGHPVGAFIQPRVRPLIPTMAHALFFDQTHDNKSPIETRSAFDMLPNTALVSMACCASGSNRGYDQMVPHHIHVVKEERLYPSWADWDMPDKKHINYTFGITKAKKLINDLHLSMGYRTCTSETRKDKHHFSQVYVDQIDGNCVSVTRHNPVTHQSIVMLARNCFYKPEKPEETGYIRPITVQGIVESILFEMQTCHTKAYEYAKDSDFINGLPDYYLKMQENIPAALSKMIKVEVAPDGMTSTIHFVNFTPGSVIAFRSVLPVKAQSAILEIRRGLGQFGYLMRSYSGRSMVDESFESSNFRSIVSNLSLSDLNIVLFRCRGEEESDGNGFSTYDIPHYGHMLYCGLRGVSSALSGIRAHNDLGHPLCGNLRDGDWLPSYIAKRLLVHPGTEKLGKWFENIFTHLSDVPRFLIPSYFDAIVTGSYVILREHAFSLMSEFVQDGSTFVQALAMGSVTFCGYVKDSRLPFLSPNLKAPKPPTVQVKSADKEIKEEEACLTLAAGFPHFSSGYMRNWGRDTFISLRGLLLLTGRQQEARYIILGFAGCLRHGLIPNLLNEGLGARHNCRDATWWWLQAIQEYCKMVPDGISILQDKVARMYPNDKDEPQAPGLFDQSLQDVMQEALQQHATGVKYREKNAGPKIDEQMKDEGFNNEIGVRWDTGFVFGGNEHNCGTWMDKMGSSTKAGTRGKPATPRDGSAVEIIGLSASATLWLHTLHSKGQYPYEGVKATIDGVETVVTFKDWFDKICAHFEECFWVNTDAHPDEKHPELIFRRGMYKDTYMATQFWTNTQLRPNFPISIVVAPDLFNPEKAWKSLETAEQGILGPLGMKTLDPQDWSHVAYYDNANDSEDPKIAKGFSYHQGPEWLWPIGYFLRAKLIVAKKLEASRPGILKDTVLFIKKTLTKHYDKVMKSGWRSLPELTNANGEENHFGCPAQAWSVSCVLEVLYDLEHLDVPVTAAPGKSAENAIIAPCLSIKTPTQEMTMLVLYNKCCNSNNNNFQAWKQNPSVLLPTMMSSEQSSKPSPPEGGCNYYVARKKRYCRFKPGQGFLYCAEHAGLMGEDLGRKRVQCPFEPKHTCYADKLNHHMKKCPSRPKQMPPYYNASINSGNDDGEKVPDPKVTVLSVPEEEIKTIIDKVNSLYKEYVSDLEEQILTHECLRGELDNPSYGPAALRHRKQQASLIGHMDNLNLLRNGMCYLEMGAGKGQLSHWLHEAMVNYNDTVFVLIDRSHVRNKMDNLHKEEEVMERIRIDIEHLKLDKVPTIQTHDKPVVAFGKHLCGPATDLSLRCVCETLNIMEEREDEDGNQKKRLKSASRELAGTVIALCCHHRCTWKPYVGKKFFKSCGLTARHFQILSSMSSWATCAWKGWSAKKKQDKRLNSQTGDQKNAQMTEASGENSGDINQRHTEVTVSQSSGEETNSVDNTGVDLERKTDHNEDDKHVEIDREEKTVSETDKEEIEAEHEHVEQVITSSINKQFTQEEREAIGRKCKRLIDYGRIQYLQDHGLQCSLKVYIEEFYTPENVVLLAAK